jgi:hypothetical protein
VGEKFMSQDEQAYNAETGAESQETKSGSEKNNIFRGAAFDFNNFLTASSQLAELERTDSHFFVNLGESDEKRLRVAGYPCRCPARWFDIPAAAIESILLLGVEFCCETIRPHIVLKLKPEFDTLLVTFSEMQSFQGADFRLADDNRLRQDTAINVVWQWDNNPTTCRDALNYVETDKGVALNRLKDGQKHNKPVQTLYEVAQSRLPDFWDIVAMTSYAPADFSGATVNLNWQYSNNLTSLDNADREWRTNVRKYKALYELLSGQKHNVNVMNQYRACYARDANSLFAIVQRILGK